LCESGRRAGSNPQNKQEELLGLRVVLIGIDEMIGKEEKQWGWIGCDLPRGIYERPIYRQEYWKI